MHRTDRDAVTSASADLTPFYEGPVRWLTGTSDSELDGFSEIHWQEVKHWVSEARGTGMQRESLNSPAQPWLDWLSQVDRLAVVDVDLDGPESAADLLGFVVEPATRRGIELVIRAHQEIEELDPIEFIEEELGYAHSLERLRWRLREVRRSREPAPQLKETDFAPDPTQAAAVEASDGPVQIIAPAGSGKTTVLVERVRELRRRGVPAKRIACLTFNRAAKAEMESRLQAAGVGSVEAFTFHGLGRRILIDAGELPSRLKIGTPTLAQWRRLAFLAHKKTEVWVETGEATEKLSQIKLGLLLTPEQYAEVAAESGDPEQLAMATIYTEYEKMQRQERRVDYDDLVHRAVLLLRGNEEVRGRWQARYEQLLVDEYQDIEPAQELIVRIVASPDDKLFCVGDEDQTLYAFRRASVERIICLDELYPGLERVSLGINYRCPAKVVAASRSLIGINRVRFPKPIEPSPYRPEDEGQITIHEVTGAAEDATEIAKLLKTRQRGEVAVLARTTNLLRPVALACADLDVPIDGNEKLFEPRGARLALQQHLRLALHPEEADSNLIRAVCRTPSRSLNPKAEHPIAASLRQGQSFEGAFERIPAPRRAGGSLLAPGELFEALRDAVSAKEAVFLLRGEGGLDAWFEEADELGGLDQFECEALERAEKEAGERSPAEYLADLERQAAKLKAIRDEKNGIELLTIHGSKGRQWPDVIVVGCDEGSLPHARAQKVTPEEEARGEGMEAERRLAYVAFTRAQRHLHLHHDREMPSPFLREAELLSRRSRAPRAAPPPPRPPEPSTVKGKLGRLLGRSD
jgi:ATP-dependent DNA helicase UvrD/PcrA